MKEDVRRIIKMVEEGKISSHDAMELIEAIDEAEHHTEGSPNGHSAPNDGSSSTTSETSGGQTEYSTNDHKDPFRSIIDVIEGFGKEATSSIEWKDLSEKVRNAAIKGMDSVRDVVKDMSEGSFKFMLPGERREIHLPLSLPEGKKLRIENACGNIHIRGNAGLGEVVAKTEFKSTSTQPEPKQRATEYTLVIEESDSEVIIRQGYLESASVNLEIFVQGSITSDLKTVAGNITAQNVGSTKGGTRSGSVSIIDVTGNLELSTISGNIRVRNSSEGDIQVESRSGNVYVGKATGAVQLKSTSGDIEASEISGKSSHLDTVSGSLSLDLSGPSDASANVRSVSGSIALILPDNADVNVSLNSISGKIDANLPLEGGNQTDKGVTGRMGSGSGRIEVSTVSGNIAVKMPVHQAQV